MTDPIQPPALPKTNYNATHWTPLTREERRSAMAAAIAILAVLTLAAILTPDERGIGTHQQIGLPPCMTETIFGIPCPFCGMTTSFSHMAHGQVTQAITVQPAGALGFVVSATLALALLVAVATGKSPTLWKTTKQSPWPYAIGAIVIATAWVYKIITYSSPT